MSDAFDQAMAGLGGAAPAPSSAPTSSPAPVSSADPYGGYIANAAQTYNVDPRLIRAVIQTESSGRPSVVSNQGAVGLMQVEPDTAKGMGVHGDLTDPQTNINAGTQYLSQLLGRYRSPEAALMAYHGGDDQKQWGPKTQAFPGQVLANFQKVPAATQTASLAPAPSAAPAKSQSDAFDNAMSSLQQAPAPTPAAPAQAQPGPLKQFGQAAAGLADTVLSAPGAAAGAVDYAARRALQQSPQQAQAASQNDFGGALHPVGNAFGVTNTPGYQNEATQRAGQAVGGVINKGVNAVANATGLPQQDVANMAGSLSLAVPGALKAVGRVAGDAAVETAAGEIPGRTPAAATPSGPAMQARPMVGGGAASANLNPYPQLTGEDTSRGAFPQVKLSKVAQDVTPEEQGVRANIANQIMGDNSGQVRSGVVTGNENTLRDENAAAKSPNQTPATQALRGQIANEQQALTNFAEQRVNATGASQVLGSDEERGRVINDALYGPDNSLSSYLTDAKRQIYNTARDTAGDNPIQTQHVDNLMSDPQFQAGVRLSGNEGTLGGASDLINLARTTGFRDPVTGDMLAPNSVAAWDAVRKSINGEWSPSNRNVIRQINGAIDQDIAATGGEEMYKLGDRIHQVQQTLLDSKGIGSVLGEYDANGIKTGPSLESIPSKLNSMPLDQWQHIHDTLDDLSRGQIRGAPDGMPPVPQEVQQSAGAALNEMHGALARSVYEAGSDKAGVWNQNSANKVLNSSVGQKITRNFSPDEVANFHTLNYGGQIMPGVHSYEGAGQQLSRLSKPGYVERYAPHAGASAGAAVGHAIPIPGAGYVGAAVGERLGGKLSDMAAGQREKKQFSNVTNEMRRNAQLGEQQSVPLNQLVNNVRGNP